MGLTVNQLLYGFVGSNPTLPTFTVLLCGGSSIGRVLAFQAGGCGFEPRSPLCSNKGYVLEEVLFCSYSHIM